VKTKEVSRELQQLSERLNRSLRDRANISRAITAAVNEDGFYVGIDLRDKKSNYCFLL
jgi:hypothetical protein